MQEENSNKMSTRSCYAMRELCYKQIWNGTLNPLSFYRIMLSDEKMHPIMRTFNPNAKYLEHFFDCYSYYFKNCHKTIKQRYQTLHLAIGYFTQWMMKSTQLHHTQIELCVATCLLLASKYDEIDYNLPSFEYIQHHMKSEYTASLSRDKHEAMLNNNSPISRDMNVSK